MDAQDRAEQAISRHVRDAIEAAGCMPDGRSLEWHGADLESFAGAVLRALASGDSIAEQWAAIREARDRHIIEPITDIAIATDGADLAREFEQTGIEDRARLNMARIVASARTGGGAVSPNELAVTIAAMRNFGGSFVRRLADLLAVADPENATRLIAAFPEHFKKYGPGSDPFIATMFGGEVAA